MQNNTFIKPAMDNFTSSYARNIVWAVNVGGPAYIGTDNIRYEEDKLALISEKGAASGIKGSQDAALYESYREGELVLTKPLPNGVYAITLKFVEPHPVDFGDRVFDVVMQDEIAIGSLDIKLARDGNHLSSLDRTAFGVEVHNGELKIALKSVVGTPVLSALIVRRQDTDMAEWELTWQDEFDYEGRPDPKKWVFDEWDARKVNDEDQAYTSREKNARVTDGKLVIEAHKEQYANAQYTSARLHTLGTMDLDFGRIDVRAKLPAGQGTWSAIWMLPSDPYEYSTTCYPGEDWQGSETCDAWPNSGEIDIMEHVGYDMNIVHGTVHNKAYYWINQEQRKASIEGQNVAQAFHVYSVEWTPDYVIVLMNNVPYFYYKNEQSGWKAWPFDHPYHLIMNLAIGGAWGRAGGPIDDSIFPVQMEIGYVRFYKAK